MKEGLKSMCLDACKGQPQTQDISVVRVKYGICAAVVTLSSWFLFVTFCVRDPQGFC